MKKFAYLVLIVGLFAALAVNAGCGGQTAGVEKAAKTGQSSSAVQDSSSTVTQSQNGTSASEQSTYEEPDATTTPT